MLLDKTTVGRSTGAKVPRNTVHVDAQVNAGTIEDVQSYIII